MDNDYFHQNTQKYKYTKTMISFYYIRITLDFQLSIIYIHDQIVNYV